MEIRWCSCGAAFFYATPDAHIAQKWPKWAPEHYEVDMEGNRV